MFVSATHGDRERERERERERRSSKGSLLFGSRELELSFLAVSHGVPYDDMSYDPCGSSASKHGKCSWLPDSEVNDDAC